MPIEKTQCPNNDLISHLKQGGTVICVNQRLTNHIKELFNEHMLSSGATAWETPGIFAFSTWLQQLYRWLIELYGIQGYRLIDSHQMRFIWYKILIDSKHTEYIQHIMPLLNEALASWKTINDYEIPHSYRVSQDYLDAYVFQEWLAEYLRFCKKNAMLDEYCLPAHLHKIISQESISFDESLLFLGFDSFPPATEKLLALLVSGGMGVLVCDYTENEATTELRQYQSVEDEIRSAAIWARKQLLNNRNQQIAVVVPDLKNLRSKIAPVFEDILEGDRNLAFNSDPYQRAFNISIGESLLDAPLVKTAGLLIKLATNTISKQELHQLILSPYISYEECNQLLQHRLATALQTSTKEDNWLYRVSGLIRSQNIQASGFLMAIKQTIDLVDKSKRKDSAEQRQKLIRQILAIWQWPVARNLGSIEYQQWSKFSDLLNNVQSIAALPEECTLTELGNYLIMTARATIFQAETAPANIQIMGVLEASGLNFDRAWLLGFNEGKWPGPYQRSPFIPQSLQKQYQVDMAYPDSMLAIYRAMTRRLLSCANEIIISYAAYDGDEALQASPLLPDIQPVITDVADFDDLDRKIFRSADTEILIDNIGPKVSTDEIVRGGIKILALQAACPFHAFTEIRLNTQPEEEIEIGYDARVRGILIHVIAEKFWQRVENRDRLSQLSPDERSQYAEFAVNEAIKDTADVLPQHVPESILEIERQRLKNLLLESLEVDEQRESFTVKAVEHEINIDISNLNMKLRIDRIDVDANNNHIMIDYKSSAPRYQDFFASRLFNPQLPVYTLYSKQDIEAIAYQQIKSGDCKIEGIASDKLSDKCFRALNKCSGDSVPADWSELKSQWQNAINLVANEFISGIASVTPMLEANACQHCDLQAVCRINDYQDVLHDSD